MLAARGEGEEKIPSPTGDLQYCSLETIGVNEREEQNSFRPALYLKSPRKLRKEGLDSKINF